MHKSLRVCRFAAADVGLSLTTFEKRKICGYGAGRESVLHTAEQRRSSGLKNHRSPRLLQRASPPDLQLSAHSRAELTGMSAKQKKIKNNLRCIYLSVVGPLT